MINLDTQRKILAILKVLHQNGRPMGSLSLSRQLDNGGIDLCERMVRYYLEMTDQAGFTRNLGRRGRIITDRGMKELDVGVVIDKVGYIASRIDEMAYNMTFDLDKMGGTVILNTTLIPRDARACVLEEMRLVMEAGLGMGRYIRLDEPGAIIDNIQVPDDHIAISTVCSVILNGVLLRHGIIMTSRFGGLLELHDGRPVRFSQIIHYDGSTLDPLVTFIKGRMTSVRQATRTGVGAIGASFREIPTVALTAAREVINRLEAIGLGGVLMIGKPNQPLLDIPVGYGRVGIIVAGGLNPVATAEELDFNSRYQALHSLCDFNQLKLIDRL